MHNLKHVMLALFCGIFLGLFTVFLALQDNWGFDRVTIGPWVGSPRAGGVDSDPYTKALIVQKASLPLGGGEGVAFIAETDTAHNRLEASCIYHIRGSALPTRWWTLTVSDTSGALFANPLNRYGFTSQELTRDDKGEFDITISSRVQPWNWVPVPPDGRLRFTLRFYDTPLTTPSDLEKQTMPDIVRGECA